ncbi:MAG: hypothetical protein AB1896_09355 [Thermodesulfobacteriota bacterium]
MKALAWVQEKAAKFIGPLMEEALESDQPYKLFLLAQVLICGGTGIIVETVDEEEAIASLENIVEMLKDGSFVNPLSSDQLDEGEEDDEEDRSF